MTQPIDRWWEHLDPALVVDEWMAKQVIRFHERGGGTCAGCSKEQACERLAAARAMLGDGSTTDASASITERPTVRQ